MKFVLSPRRAAVAAGFAAIGAIPVLCAAPALAADDKSTVSAVMELMGVSSDPGVATIDYSERPKLVLPPNRAALPEPRADASRPSGWPAEMSAERRRSADRYARISGGQSTEEKKPGVLERALSMGQTTSAPVMDEPTRAQLTEPPSGYRRPTQDLSRVGDPDTKKSSWWNPLSWGGSQSTQARGSVAVQERPEEEGAIASLRKLTGMSSSSPASGYAPRGQQAASSDSGSLFRMPSFVRGSDKD